PQVDVDAARPDRGRPFRRAGELRARAECVALALGHLAAEVAKLDLVQSRELEAERLLLLPVEAVHVFRVPLEAGALEVLGDPILAVARADLLDRLADRVAE